MGAGSADDRSRGARRGVPWLALPVAVVMGAVLAFAVDRWRADGGGSSSWQRPARVSRLERLPLAPDDVVLLGASLVEQGEWSELLPGRRVRNRGVAGDTVADVLARLDPIVAAGPRAVFVMVGLNDVLSATPAATIAAGHRELVRRLRQGSPHTRVVLMSLLPVRREGPAGDAVNAAIDEVNAQLEQTARDQGCELLDGTALFRDAHGRLGEEFTLDGVHLTGAGYALWGHLLEDCGWL